MKKERRLYVIHLIDENRQRIGVLECYKTKQKASEFMKQWDNSPHSMKLELTVYEEVCNPAETAM